MRRRDGELEEEDLRGVPVRRPLERLSQRQLVYELRYAIDEGKMREAAALAASHPRAMRSAHVLHNIGARRARALSGGPEAARSFVRSDG